MADHRCDVCGRACGEDDYSADGCWMVCDECLHRAPEYVCDQMCGIRTDRREDTDRWIQSQREKMGL